MSFNGYWFNKSQGEDVTPITGKYGQLGNIYFAPNNDNLLQYGSGTERKGSFQVPVADSGYGYWVWPDGTKVKQGGIFDLSGVNIKVYLYYHWKLFENVGSAYSWLDATPDYNPPVNGSDMSKQNKHYQSSKGGILGGSKGGILPLIKDGTFSETFTWSFAFSELEAVVERKFISNIQLNFYNQTTYIYKSGNYFLIQGVAIEGGLGPKAMALKGKVVFI